MSSLAKNELLGWIANEIAHIASGLGDGSISVADAQRFLGLIGRKIAAEATSEIQNFEVAECHLPPTSAPSAVPFVRCTVSRDDSAVIESIRRETYELSATDENYHSPETACGSGLFADEKIAQKYITKHLRRCMELVERGELSTIPSVASIADSLCVLSRELALEPCSDEGDFRFMQFIDSGTDDEYLKLFNVVRPKEFTLVA